MVPAIIPAKIPRATAIAPVFAFFPAYRLLTVPRKPEQVYRDRGPGLQPPLHEERHNAAIDR